MPLNTFTLGGYAVQDNPLGIAHINRFVMRTGGSRAGRGSLLMLGSDYTAMLANNPGQTVPMTISGAPGPGVTFNVVVGGAESVSTSIKQQFSDDFVRVTVYDTRCQYFIPQQSAYNVIQDGFPLSGSTPQCYTDTLEPQPEAMPPTPIPWTWATLMQDCEAFGNDIVDIIPWTPYNIIWDNVPRSRIVDDVAAQLFYIVGFDYTQTGASAVYLYRPGTGFDTNTTLFQQATQAAPPIGGAMAQRNLSRLPANFVVVFPGVGGSDVFKNRAYTTTVPTNFPGATGKIPLHVGSQIAIYSGSDFANKSALNAVANDLAARAAAFISQPFLQYDLAGIWPFKPDGVYRQVEWINDRHGAQTILKSDNAKDWLVTDPLNDPINLVSNQEVIGLGSMMVGMGTGGTKYIFPPLRPVFILTGDAAQGGCYTMQSLLIPTTGLVDPTSSSGEFTESQIGSASGTTVYGINIREANASSAAWMLDTTGTTQPRIILNAIYYGNASDGKAMYLIDECQ